MKNTNDKCRAAGILRGRRISRAVLAVFVLVLASVLFVPAQSTNQNYPTPVKTNEIVGAIKARDLGDSRLTVYFYAFDADQGDVFVNIVTKNLDGDIDIFTAENLRPLTKIRVYSDNPDGETGRAIYLRQSQRLLLRIEGKTPTDEPATFRIKFAGSFKPLVGVAEVDETEPSVKSTNESDIKVNSVGTIIEVKPKPTPNPKPAATKTEKPIVAETKTLPKTEEESKPVADVSREDEKVSADTEAPAEKREDEKPAEEVPADAKPSGKTPAPKKSAAKTPKTPKTKQKPSDTAAARTEDAPRQPAEKKPAVKKNAPTPLNADQLASIKLVVLFKDGTKIERSMDEVLKFGVDKGILTIIAKNGEIGRYSMLDVEKVTIE